MLLVEAAVVGAAAESQALLDTLRPSFKSGGPITQCPHQRIAHCHDVVNEIKFGDRRSDACRRKDDAARVGDSDNAFGSVCGDDLDLGVVRLTHVRSPLG